MITASPLACSVVTITLPDGTVKTDHVDCKSPTCPLSSANEDL